MSQLRPKGFRPPCGLWRVTLERPKVTKGLLPRQAVRCAVIPDGATDSLNSPRRLAGGCNTVPDGDWGGRLRRCWPLRGAQNGGCSNFCILLLIGWESPLLITAPEAKLIAFKALFEHGSTHLLFFFPMFIVIKNDNASSTVYLNQGCTYLLMNKLAIICLIE